jgi:hypothetical protein
MVSFVMSGVSKVILFPTAGPYLTTGNS